MRKTHRLTAMAVTRAKEPGLYADGAGLNLQVKATPSGGISKSWVLRYMLDGRPRYMGLGPFRDFSLAEARERAKRARQMLADGIDPIEARLAERDERRKATAERMTFKEAAERFIDVHADGWRNAKHRAQWRSTLATYAYGKIGARPIAAIDDALVNETLAPIWTAKPETARRVKQRIDRVVQWVRGGMPLPAPSASKRVTHFDAMPYADVPAFMARLAERDSISARALEFTILTAARTGEVIGARWSEIDMDAKVWTVPAERMKSGRAHRVPLTERALAILRDLPREADNAHVFIGGREGAGLGDLSMARLLKQIDGHGYTTHGMRSAFKDWAAEQTNFPRDLSEAALAHAIRDKTQAAYERGDKLVKRRKLMEAWERYVSKPPVAHGADVVTLSRAVA